MTQKEQKNQIKNLLACAERLLCCMRVMMERSMLEIRQISRQAQQDCMQNKI